MTQASREAMRTDLIMVNKSRPWCPLSRLNFLSFLPTFPSACQEVPILGVLPSEWDPCVLLKRKGSYWWLLLLQFLPSLWRAEGSEVCLDHSRVQCAMCSQPSQSAFSTLTTKCKKSKITQIFIFLPSCRSLFNIRFCVFLTQRGFCEMCYIQINSQEMDRYSVVMWR